MALTATEISTVLDEIAPVLFGNRIQKIHQPTDRTFVLEIRAPGRTHRLLISCHPESARLHLTTSVFKNPPTPPPFCQFLRAHLQGGQIDRVEQIQRDRIIQLALSTKEGPYRLVAELTGRTANILLLDGAGLIRRDLNGLKDRVGQLYLPPTPLQHKGSAADLARFTQNNPESPFPLSAAIDAHYHRIEAASVVEAMRNARARVLDRKSTRLNSSHLGIS